MQDNNDQAGASPAPTVDPGIGTYEDTGERVPVEDVLTLDEWLERP